MLETIAVAAVCLGQHCNIPYSKPLSVPAHIPRHPRCRVQAAFCKFKEDMEASPNKLFVMIVDESHFAYAGKGALDMIVNDFWWQHESGEACQVQACSYVVFVLACSVHSCGQC